MNNNDIQQKLALLPEGLAEENIQSWQLVIKFFELLISQRGYSRWISLLDLIREFSKSEQIKLYRAGMSLTALMISTKEKYGLEKGDPYIVIDMQENNSMVIGYSASVLDRSKSITCNSDEIISVLQPLLDRLWNETRGKENA